MRNNMGVYVEYSSGIDGYYLNIRALTALKKIYKQSTAELVVSFDKDALNHHNCQMVVTIDDANILFA